MDFHTLTHYTHPPTNYTGTALFLTYILLALITTTYITSSLYTRYVSIQSLAFGPRARHVKIYAFLATLSFATLSYNMLNFLLAHYARWSGKTVLEGGLVEWWRGLGKWMLNSTLFEDFAGELVGRPEAAVWMQGAVVGTLVWGCWVGRKGVFPAVLFLQCEVLGDGFAAEVGEREAKLTM